MADMNITNQDELPRSKLSEMLHGQLDEFCNVDALLSCAANSLLDKGEAEENARRVICMAKEILLGIRDRIDEAALEASHPQG